MTMTGISALERAVHKANVWINELQDVLQTDADSAYGVLRSVLRALRDRMTVEEASDLGAQLPVLIRGVFYDGFNPSRQPSGERDKESFLRHISSDLSETHGIDPETAAIAVFQVLSRHCTQGQVEHARGQLPGEVQELWPTS